MLTAKLTSGEIISLVGTYSKLKLSNLRCKEQFYCRVCSERVILKLGDKRIYHFAHEKGSNCTENYERESDYHMNGKQMLYQWLKAQGLSPELEFYYPSIRQRADIAFDYEGKRYCLEFQCSPISEELFMKRTEGYRKLNLHPIWILGGNNIHRRKPFKISLTNFHYLFLRENSSQQIYLPCFCPEIDQFIRLDHIFATTTRNAHCKLTLIPKEGISLLNLLDPRIEPPIDLVQRVEWGRDLSQYKLSFLASHTPTNNSLLLEFYTRSISPYVMPPWVGLPLKLNLAIETAPFIWQSYIFINHFYSQPLGAEIQFHDVYKTILTKIAENQLKVRNFPCINRKLLPFVVQDYLTVLSSAGVLKKIKNNLFVIDKPVNMANNMEEWWKDEEELYSRMFFHKV